MLYYIGGLLAKYFGGHEENVPFYEKALRAVGRFLNSYAVLIVLAVYVGFFVTRYLLPCFFKYLPLDRGRDFTLSKEVSKGKPTGSGVVFVSFFVILSFIFAPVDFSREGGTALFISQAGVLALTWLMMLTGYLDDRSEKGWGEYIKAFLDLLICAGASILIALCLPRMSGSSSLYFWLPFIKDPVAVPFWLYIAISTVMLWVSVNTTNCTDGVDGLSSSLVLLALMTLGIIFYIILGHQNIVLYLFVPQLESVEGGNWQNFVPWIPFIKGGASWAIIIFTFAGVVMGYLWHNAFPSKVLMGDAGSRALGFFIGVCVMLSGNPLLFLITSSIIFINGGMGLLKVALKRFLHISIFENVRFPLHDHMRKNHGWSPTQVLIKFLMIQILITIGMLGIFFKIR
ncbi:MAG: phospho-N-acetylmuramoyl-pentapeptide-transferase [Treponema sp.]|nr:phospho-N-acetylmuramoyl-pentapeptide-transferase [Treponema sp.]